MVNKFKATAVIFRMIKGYILTISLRQLTPGKKLEKLEPLIVHHSYNFKKIIINY